MPLPPFLIPLIVGLVAQALKPLFNREWYASLNTDGHKIPRYGGMPSAHSAAAFSVVTVVGWVDGIFSTTFLLAVIILIWTLDDALRMRLFLGRYGAALRQIIKGLPTGDQKGFPYLEARLGHKPREVLAGAALGIGISWLLLVLFL
jgi:acid phosphatase family membrane protein YuiD